MIDPEIQLDILHRINQIIWDAWCGKTSGLKESYRVTTLCALLCRDIMVPLNTDQPVLRIGPKSRLYRLLRDTGNLGIIQPFLEGKQKK